MSDGGWTMEAEEGSKRQRSRGGKVADEKRERREVVEAGAPQLLKTRKRKSRAGPRKSP